MLSFTFVTSRYSQRDVTSAPRVSTCDCAASLPPTPGWQRSPIITAWNSSKCSLKPPATSLLMPCALRPVPCALRPAPCALRPAPCALCPVPCALCPVPCALCHVPCAMCHVPCALCPAIDCLLAGKCLLLKLCHHGSSHCGLNEERLSVAAHLLTTG
jgi:hypothetical protein